MYVLHTHTHTHTHVAGDPFFPFLFFVYIQETEKYICFPVFPVLLLTIDLKGKEKETQGNNIFPYIKKGGENCITVYFPFLHQLYSHFLTPPPPPPPPLTHQSPSFPLPAANVTHVTPSPQVTGVWTADSPV